MVIQVSVYNVHASTRDLLNNLRPSLSNLFLGLLYSNCEIAVLENILFEIKHKIINSSLLKKSNKVHELFNISLKYFIASSEHSFNFVINSCLTSVLKSDSKIFPPIRFDSEFFSIPDINGSISSNL